MLIDTHIFVWVAEGRAGNMGRDTETLMRKSFGDCYISMASFFEIKIKQRRGSLSYLSITKLETKARLEGATILDIQLKHLAELPSLDVTPHGDPFDLLLIAQAVAEGLPLLTCDERILEVIQPGLRLIDGRK
jgi:PIN domain nuclease of toxin-antitoxin system